MEIDKEINNKQNEDSGRSTGRALWSISFILILIITFLGNINGNGMHNGVALVVEKEGLPASLSGTIILAFSLAALAARFPAGSCTDRYGSKPVIIAGCIAAVAGTAFGAFGGSILFLFPSRILMGIGFSLIVTAATAAVADVIPANRMGEGIGYQGLAFAAAFALGPMIAIKAAGYGRLFLFLLFGLMGILCIVLTMLVRFKAKKAEVKAADKPAHKISLRDFIEPKVFPAALITLLLMLAMSFYFSFMSLYAQVNDISGINLFFIAAAVMMVSIRMSLGRAFDRKPARLFLIPGLLCGMAGFILPAVFATTWALVVSGVMYGIFCGICQPLMTLVCIRNSDGGRNGAAIATYYIGCDIGVASGSFLWGWAIDSLGFFAAFMMAAFVLFTDIILSFFLIKSRG